MGFAKRRGEKLNLEKDIYYTEITGLKNELLTYTKLRRGIDEGYFGTYNLDVNTSTLKQLVQTINAIRNRNHLLIINLTKLTRGAKPLLEIANFWFHKPNLENALLYVRDRELTGDDCWVVEDMMKAKTLGKKRYLMKNNPNFITRMKIKEISKKIFEDYEDNKRAEQEKLGKVQAIIEEGKKRQMLIMDKLESDYKAHKFDFDSMRGYIEKKYGIPDVDTDRWITRFRKHMGETRMATQMLQEMEGDEHIKTEVGENAEEKDE